jgi:ribosome-binding protein aMBF1 (putative translation factor)
MKAKTEKGKTSDAIEFLDRMAGDSPELKRLSEEARINAAVAQLIYDARQKSGLSQAELAERIGSKQTVISRLEDADYDGHSLSMLQRIAAALGKEITIKFHDTSKARSKAGHPRRLAHAQVES